MTADTVIFGNWLFTADAADSVLTDHAVVIKDGKISDILPAEAAEKIPAEKVFRLDTCALLPGFVNTHCHSPMNLLRCVGSDLSTLDWLHKAIWPLEGKLMSPEFVRDGSLLGSAEMLSGGVTCGNDMYFFPEEIVESQLRLGMRAAAGGFIIGFPSAYAADEETYFQNAVRLYETYKDNPLVSVNMAPHAVYSVSAEMLRKSMQFAEEHGLVWQIHLSETEEEVRDCIKAHGVTPVKYLSDLGCLKSNTVAAHAVHLTDDDIELFAKSGASIAHCPTSNMKLGCGAARIADLIDAGVNVALGTDGAASGHTLNILGEMRMAGLIAKGFTRNPSALPIRTLLRMATVNGARALGLDGNIGSLEKGKDADLIAVDLSGYQTVPVSDPLSVLVYSAERECVSACWVRGNHVVDKQHGVIKTPQWESILSESHILTWHNRVCEILKGDCAQYPVV